MLTRIATYPEHERLAKIVSFRCQLPFHFSFMELAEYSQNAYLLSQTAVALVLFGGRLILAHNRMLYPGRKWFMREFEHAPLRPESAVDLATRLLREPSIDHARSFYDEIENSSNWPQPAQGCWQRIHADNVWNWRDGGVSLAER